MPGIHTGTREMTETGEVSFSWTISAGSPKGQTAVLCRSIGYRITFLRRTGQSQWNQKFNHTQPGKQNVKHSQNQIHWCIDPQIIIPSFFLHRYSLSTFFIMPAGQVFTHRPQPMHCSGLTTALTPCFTAMAFFGHTFMHAPQATHLSPTTARYRLILFLLFLFKYILK